MPPHLACHCASYDMKRGRKAHFPQFKQLHKHYWYDCLESISHLNKNLMHIDDSVCSNSSDQFFCLLLCSWNGMEIWILVRAIFLKWSTNRKLVLHWENLFPLGKMWIVGHIVSHARIIINIIWKSILLNLLFLARFIFAYSSTMANNVYPFNVNAFD